MSNVIELPHRPAPSPVKCITSKVGHSLLEFMQETRGMPYYAPTVQVKVLKRGSCTDYEPANPLAKQFAKLIGRTVFSEGHLVLIEDMGISVERRLP